MKYIKERNKCECVDSKAIKINNNNIIQCLICTEGEEYNVNTQTCRKCNIREIFVNLSCIPCPDQSVANKTTGKCEFCKQGEFLNGDFACEKCSSRFNNNYISRFNDISKQTECIDCQSASEGKKIADTTNNICVNCFNINAIYDYTNNKCILCHKGYKPSKDNNKCIILCKPGQFYNKDIQLCEETCVNKINCINGTCKGDFCECQIGFIDKKCDKEISNKENFSYGNLLNSIRDDPNYIKKIADSFNKNNITSVDDIKNIDLNKPENIAYLNTVAESADNLVNNYIDVLINNENIEPTVDIFDIINTSVSVRAGIINAGKLSGLGGTGGINIDKIKQKENILKNQAQITKLSDTIIAYNMKNGIKNNVTYTNKNFAVQVYSSSDKKIKEESIQ